MTTDRLAELAEAPNTGIRALVDTRGRVGRVLLSADHRYDILAATSRYHKGHTASDKR